MDTDRATTVLSVSLQFAAKTSVTSVSAELLPDFPGLSILGVTLVTPSQVVHRTLSASVPLARIYAANVPILKVHAGTGSDLFVTARLRVRLGADVTNVSREMLGMAGDDDWIRLNPPESPA